MRSLKPVRWKEGMFLRPHHMQQHELYLESRESSRLKALESYFWGLIALEIQEDSLSNFMMSVRSLQAVLPGGALIDIPGNARLSGRPFDTYMEKAGRPLDVHIGVRALEPSSPLVAAREGDSPDVRFVTVDQEVYDLDAGGDPATLEMMEYNARLFFGDEPRHGYDTLQITRLVSTGDKGNPVAVDETFAPPSLALRGSAALHRMSRAVVERLSVILRDLGKARGSSDPDPLILYQAISGSLPVLKDMVQDGQVHPRTMYQELARLAGSLFYREKTGRSADEVPSYDHDEPARVFETLRQLIFELSEMVIRQPFTTHEMERVGDEFRVSMPPEAKTPGVRLFLEVLADDSTPKVRTLVLGAKISSPDRIATLRDYALPGIPTEALPGPPPELGPGRKGTYFRLKHEHEEWGGHVLPAGKMTAFLLSAPEDVKFNLIIIFPEV